jgi:predicted nuclease of predicted toxin-antitoxin system
VTERYLADENLPRAVLPPLRAAGLDIDHIGEIAPGVSDLVVAEEAIRRDAILLTFDRDFGELTFRHRVAVPGVVLFRLGQQPPWVVIGFLEAFFASGRTLRGYFTVASLRRVRQRPIVRVVDDDT